MDLNLPFIIRRSCLLLCMIFVTTLSFDSLQAQNRIKILNEIPAERTEFSVNNQDQSLEKRTLKENAYVKPGISIPMANTKAQLTISTFPWSESFEDSSATRDSWTQAYVTQEWDWTFASGSTGGLITSAYDGDLNARFVSENGGGSTYLISPELDISGLTNPQLSFWLAQESWFGDQNETKVYYRSSTDSTATWTEIAYYDSEITSWTEYSMALPDPSATYQIAFEGINGWGRANTIDLVTVEAGSSDPEFAGASSLDFGTTYLGGSFTLDYIITNSGAADLSVDVSSSSSEIAVSGAPLTIAPASTDTLSVTFTPAALDTVNYAGSFELTTNDPNNGSVLVNVSSDVQDPNPADYISEDFENTASFSRPDGWTGNMSVRSSGGVDNSQRLTVNNWSSTPLGQIVTPFINLGDSPVLKFQYRVVEYTGYPGTPTPAEEFAFGVFVSTDYGQNYDLVYVSDSNDHVETLDYAEVSVDLSAYANETATVVIQSQRFSGDFYFDIDNIKAGTPPSFPIFVGDSEIDLGTTYTGESYTESYVIENTGGSDLTVSLESSSPELSVTGLPATVSPGMSDSLSVMFTPTESGTFAGSFVLTTNDTESDTVSVSVNSDVQAPPPVASVSPDSLSETLGVGETTTVNVTLSNAGTGQDLVYAVAGYASVDSTAGTMSLGSSNELDAEEANRRSVIEGWENGTIRDLTDEQQLIILEYQQQLAQESSTGAPSLQNVPSTEIEFTDFSAAGANVSLIAPSGSFFGSVESVTADFVLNEGTGFTWANDFMILLVEGDTLSADGSNFVAQIGGFSTFTSPKYAWGTGGSGAAGTPVSTTIAIDPAIDMENLSVWFGNGYSSGGLSSWSGSITLNGVFEQPSFVSDVSPATGSVAPGSSQDLTITLDATSLVSGEYNETLFISSNDPEMPFLGVSISLTAIGVTPDISVADSVEFPLVYTGDISSSSLIINSTGDATLEVSDITFDNSLFSADTTSFSVDAGSSIVVNLSYDATASGTVSGTMTISSNASSGVTLVSLSASAINPPVAEIDPSSFSIEATSGEEGVSSTLTISNTGDADLQFALGVQYGEQNIKSGASSGKVASFVYEKHGTQSVISTEDITSPMISGMKAFGDGNVSFEDSEGFVPGFIQGQNGWSTFSSNTTQPTISSEVASDGNQSLKLANESNLGTGNPVGAFSPLFFADSETMSYSVDTYIEASGGADYDVVLQSPTQDLLTSRVKFYYQGDILVVDSDSTGAIGFYQTGTNWSPGEWKTLTIEINQTEESINYYYDGVLIWEGNMYGATIVEQAIFLHDNWNAGESGYIDNFQFDAVRQWLSADQPGGTVESGSSSDVNLFYNTAIEPGEYVATLFVATNDPNAELVQIPITYTLSEALNVDYSLTLNLSDSQPNSFDLELGTSPDATVGYDPDFDQLAPPAPPDGAFDARLIVDGTSYFKAYQPTNTDETSWRVEFSPRAGYEPMTLSWNPADLPAEGTFMLMDVADGSFYSVDMRADSTVTITEDFITALTVTHKLGDEVNVSYIEGWNMVSMPVDMAHDSYLDMMPDAEAGTLFGYDSGYTASTTMAVGDGYWVSMNSDSDVTFNGAAVESLALDVAADWNMIGSVTQEANITDENSIVDAVWAYNNGYFIPTSIMPGRAYWVAATEAGTIEVSSSATASPSSLAGTIDTNLFHNLSVQSGDGEVNLYFAGELSDDISALRTAMPPAPPSGLFDVRIAGNQWISSEDVIAVELQHGSEEVNISVQGDELYELVIFSGSEELSRQELSEGETIIIPQSADNFTIGLYDASAIPDVFSLDQNYPNPFNPSTTIRFGVPEAADVKLEVFNMLGQRVATLVNESKDAGFYNVAFDASSLSSGMYIYRLQSGSFVETRKLMLIK